jgi:hypothetical protein
MTLAPLSEWHRKGLPKGCRDAFRIIWINQERGFAFLRCASETRQNEHAGIIGVCEATNSFATRFIPSRNGVTNAARAAR